MGVVVAGMMSVVTTPRHPAIRPLPSRRTASLLPHTKLINAAGTRCFARRATTEAMYFVPRASDLERAAPSFTAYAAALRNVDDALRFASTWLNPYLSTSPGDSAPRASSRRSPVVMCAGAEEEHRDS